MAIEYGPPPTAGEGIGIGRLLRRISGPPNVIDHLAYSPDGHWLAGGFGGNNGMRLFQGASGHQTRQDGDFGDASDSADFSREGQIRLYARESRVLRKLPQAAAPGGKRPFRARFALDGRYIEMGFDDTTVAKV